MEKIRAFIAIELTDELKSELGRLESVLRAGSQVPVKWAEPDSIHLTLKFLGNIVPDMADRINSIIEKAAKDIQPFYLETGGLGAFPNLKRVQVVWVGLNGEVDKLRQLQQSIENGLETLGFAPEKRPFTAHLTLGRIRNQASPDDRRNLGQLIEGTEFKVRRMKVDGISLMRSQLTREGAIYSQLSYVRLS
jgi:2'-5' RNA ligase